MKIMTKVAIGAGTVAVVAITGVTIVEINKLIKKYEDVKRQAEYEYDFEYEDLYDFEYES